jgi:hypothetical protein
VSQSMLPFEQSASHGCFVELLAGGSSGRLCLVQLGSARGLETCPKSAHRGLLGRARSHSIKTEGADALPRRDPSTSCLCLALNRNYGVPPVPSNFTFGDRLDHACPGRR